MLKARPSTGDSHWGPNARQSPPLLLASFCRRRSVTVCMQGVLSVENLVRMWLNLFPHTHLCSGGWMRPVMRKDKHVLVHWGMHPDRWCTVTHTHAEAHTETQYLPVIFFFFHSYDSWLSSSDVEGQVEEPPHSEKPWRVSTTAQMQKTGCFTSLYNTQWLI